MLKITKPTLIIDKQKCIANIKKMAYKAKRNQVELAPHFKTHQSAQVGEWFKEYGIKAISVTSVKMAKYFADSGWDTITIAFPINVLQAEELNKLAKRVNLSIFINSKESALILKKKIIEPINFYVEIDVGYNRSGLPFKEIDTIQEIIDVSESSNLNFKGFYTHAGHTYDVDTPKQVKQIHQDTLKILSSLKKIFIESNSDIKLALGDTPSCSLQENFEGIDTIGPGNFVFYDLYQHNIGSNDFEEIAICLAVPVVSIHKARNEVVVHSGWAHQGKDFLIDKNGNLHFGLIVNINHNGWSVPIGGAKVKKVSQEHGVVSLPAEIIEQIKVGDILGILPVHACATALMMKEYLTLEGKIINMML